VTTKNLCNTQFLYVEIMKRMSYNKAPQRKSSHSLLMVVMLKL